jgi:hypothetical protein
LYLTFGGSFKYKNEREYGLIILLVLMTIVFFIVVCCVFSVLAGTGGQDTWIPSHLCQNTTNPLNRFLVLLNWMRVWEGETERKRSDLEEMK